MVSSSQPGWDADCYKNQDTSAVRACVPCVKLGRSALATNWFGASRTKNIVVQDAAEEQRKAMWSKGLAMPSTASLN